MKLPTAKDLQAKIAQVEGEKASAAMKAHAAAEAEKQAFLDRISKPSGLTDEQVVEKASNIITRAVENGLTSVQIFRFPNHLCTDDGRAIDQGEAGWEKSLTGIPKSSMRSGNGSSSPTAITSSTKSPIAPAACAVTSPSS